MKKNKGSGLIFAVILLFVILAMVVTLSSVTVLETKMSQKTKSSVGAFYNSESGVEYTLNKIASADSNSKINAVPGITFNSDGSAQCPFGGCNVFLLKGDGTVIKSAELGSLTVADIKAVRSVGTQNTGEVTQRAIEAAVASGGQCYTSYIDDSTDAACLTSAGFHNKGSLGDMRECIYSGVQMGVYITPPGVSACGSGFSNGYGTIGKAYLCCQ